MSPLTSPGQSAPADPRTVRALETAIEALREQLTKADQRAEAERGRANRTERHLEDERKRVDELQAALADAVAAERIATGTAAGLRAQLDRRQEWSLWRRLRWALSNKDG
jgi:phage shock protein A